MAVFKNAVGIPDQDAINFINTSGITAPTQLGAINRLVLDLKGFFNPSYATSNIWGKMKAVYPFVGGTAESHKWNLKDPRDLDAAYRIVWSGGIVHSSTGVAFNGSTGYGSTKLIPNNNLTLYSNHISIYSRTSGSGAYDIGTYDDTRSGTSLHIFKRNGSNLFSAGNLREYVQITNNDGRGFYLNTRTASDALSTFKNQTLAGTNTNVCFNLQPTGVLIIGATSYNAGEGTIFGYTAYECAFSSIGDGLTNTEASNLYTAVQRFQTTLGRQV